MSNVMTRLAGGLAATSICLVIGTCATPQPSPSSAASMPWADSSARGVGGDSGVAGASSDSGFLPPEAAPTDGAAMDSGVVDAKPEADSAPSVSPQPHVIISPPFAQKAAHGCGYYVGGGGRLQPTALPGGNGVQLSFGIPRNVGGWGYAGFYCRFVTSPTAASRADSANLTQYSGVKFSVISTRFAVTLRYQLTEGKRSSYGEIYEHVFTVRQVGSTKTVQIPWAQLLRRQDYQHPSCKRNPSRTPCLSPQYDDKRLGLESVESWSVEPTCNSYNGCVGTVQISDMEFY